MRDGERCGTAGISAVARPEYLKEIVGEWPPGMDLPAVLGSPDLQAVLLPVYAIWSRMATDGRGIRGYCEESEALRVERVPARLRPIFRRFFLAMSAARVEAETDAQAKTRRSSSSGANDATGPAKPLDWKSWG